MNHENTKKGKHEKIEVGDWVTVPEAKGHKWKTNQGCVSLVAPPYCKVRIGWMNRHIVIDFKIEDVEKLKK